MPRSPRHGPRRQSSNRLLDRSHLSCSRRTLRGASGGRPLPSGWSLSPRPDHWRARPRRVPRCASRRRLRGRDPRACGQPALRRTPRLRPPARTKRKPPRADPKRSGPSRGTGAHPIGRPATPALAVSCPCLGDGRSPPHVAVPTTPSSRHLLRAAPHVPRRHRRKVGSVFGGCLAARDEAQGTRRRLVIVVLLPNPRKCLIALRADCQSDATLDTPNLGRRRVIGQWHDVHGCPVKRLGKIA